MVCDYFYGTFLEARLDKIIVFQVNSLEKLVNMGDLILESAFFQQIGRKWKIVSV